MPFYNRIVREEVGPAEKYIETVQVGLNALQIAALFQR
jgi:hypothetical protein